ncbi:Cu(I)-responsive transcriptional regulator [Siccirubricoccus sp. G192]|uniref:Cu(I)-responsive transcriptional regulator n=1 Tax=Siccirubricoccus sp. G192 TaxID=2849651 RepID=UPI001C2C0832|nr:Cu(I)-responsive transcriptional regulator [Siccirubricoccus sp. G192]MBV1795699.1 Cu(I)-responsive transcriptional regulator [Siccirubricoccus sp. G192]
MNIGQAAAASGVSTKMLRYYESIGLIPKAGRTEAGYRVYSGTDVNTLRFIRRARDLGLSIERIRLLVGLWQDRERSSGDVKRITEEHVAELEAKIVELTAMRDSLRELADACHGDHRPECPILRDLEGDVDRTARRRAEPLVRERRGHPLEAHRRGHHHGA